MNERKPVPYWISIPSVLLLVFGFRFAFGEENLVIGMLFFVVCVFIARSSSVEIRPLRDGLLIFLTLSAFAVITQFATIDIFLGLVINLVVLFVIVYSLFSSFDNIVYFPIVLGYLHQLNAPEGVENLPLRIAAIFAGSIITIVFYQLFHRSRSLPTAKEKMDALLDSFAHKLYERASFGESDVVTSNYEDIQELITSILSWIYRVQRRNKKTSGLDEVYISLCLSLERYMQIYIRLTEQGAPTPEERRIAYQLADLLVATKDKLISEESIDELSEKFLAFSQQKVSDSSSNAPELFEILETSTIAAHSLKRYLLLQERERIKKKSPELMHRGAEWSKDFLSSMKPNLLRFSFAFKYAITMSLSIYIVSAFKLEYGFWLVLTIALMLRPYHEDSSLRTKSRLLGNFIGVMFFVLAFTFIGSELLQFTLMIIAYIVMSREVGPTTRSVASSAFGGLALVALASHTATSTLGIERVVLVFLGIAVAFFVSRYVLPYNLSQATRTQVNTHRSFSHQILGIFLYTRTHLIRPKILEEAQAEEDNSKNLVPTTLVFETLVLYTNILEQQILFNNRFIQSKSLATYVKEQHQLINDLHYLYGVLSLETAQKPAFSHLLRELSVFVCEVEQLPFDEFSDNKSLIERIEQMRVSSDAIFGFTDDARVKIASTTLHRVLDALKCQVAFSPNFND